MIQLTPPEEGALRVLMSSVNGQFVRALFQRVEAELVAELSASASDVPLRWAQGKHQLTRTILSWLDEAERR